MNSKLLLALLFNIPAALTANSDSIPAQHTVQQPLYVRMIPQAIRRQLARTALFEHQLPATLHAPATVEELLNLVHTAKKEGKKIALVGAGKSQGGQTIPGRADDLRVSLHSMNKLINLDMTTKEATVQSGMTWRELQKEIAPRGLAVKAMQSYKDFSIGGSMGVNVHGQDVINNPLIKSVKSFKIMLADGTIKTVDRSHELFGLAIGGYGLFGIIIEVTLELTNDVTLVSKTAQIDAHQLAEHVEQHVKNNPAVEFYSARFSMDPENPLEKALVITYEKTNQPVQPLTRPARWKRALNNWMLRSMLRLSQHSTFIKRNRLAIDTYFASGEGTTTRNAFMGYSLDSLPYDKDTKKYILQEYFIPYAQLNTFLEAVRMNMKTYKIPLLNISARHVNADTESRLSFSPQETCALVFYFPVKQDEYPKTVEWTRNLIDMATSLGGRYYLPYQLIATQKQLATAYPEWASLVAKKKEYDPQEIFTNKFYEKYGKNGDKPA